MSTSLYVPKKVKEVLRKRVHKYVKASDAIAFNPSRVERDLAKMKPIKTIETIEGESDCDQTSRILQAHQRRRSKLAQMKLAVNSASFVLGKLYDEGCNYLIQQEAIAALKNEALREAAIANLLGRLAERYHHTLHLIEQIDIKTWEIKDNQRAVEYQILLFKEAIWEAKHVR